MKTKPQKRWFIYLDEKLIDIVYFDLDVTEWDVRLSLIYHDGYDQNIQIREY